MVEEKNGNIDDFLEDDILTATFQVKEKDLNVFKRKILKDEYKSLSFFSWGIYEGIATFEVSLNIATKGHALKYLAKIFDIQKRTPLLLVMLKMIFQCLMMLMKEFLCAILKIVLFI